MITCRVTGYLLSSSGARYPEPVVVAPSYNTLVLPDGRVAVGAPITVIPGADGEFEVDLIPSDRAGPYTLRIGAQRLTLTVPSRPRASLAECAEGGKLT